MFEISKSFDFCYGHRVFTQELDPELSCNMSCKCRHIHGHQGQINIYLSGAELDKRGMVIDFNELQWFKKWLDETLDHKFIMSVDDPLREILFPLSFNSVIKPEGHGIVQYDVYKNQPQEIVELYDGLVLVPFVPTSENLSKWIWEIIDKKIGHLCKVSRVQFFETPKSQSNYIN